ncbi:hypothetical protein [Mycobacterium sp.]|uniref:hypothetical protein n=1 Tax=Mycobacterium sp. TaxID=1785 RepID=UPI00126F1FCA|nr:hypothetical protein [Mycobacterium sp.]KAA8964277.1 MAG: hypothetical protein F6Q13_10315 [Mycobacterium sp.]
MATVGTAIAGIGFWWVSAMSPAVAHAQPRSMPPGEEIVCPDLAGIHYVPDPDDSNAYYICENGSQLEHEECPGVTKLDMAVTPPECLANQDMYHP